MNLFKRKKVEFPKPKMKKGEYIWRATVYKKKINPHAEDVEIWSERYFKKTDATAFKRAIECGISHNTVKIEKVSIDQLDGYML